MVTLVFAQFGENADKLNPSLTSFKKYFPESKVILYSDVKVDLDGVENRIVFPPYDKSHKRYGNRCNDLYKIIGLLEATTEYAVAIDADMRVISNEVGSLIPLIERFDVVIPANPRMLVKVDNTIGEDSDGVFDESLGNGYALNMSPIGVRTKSDRVGRLLNAYRDEMVANAVRGPTAMWRAIWKTGIMPCILPPQWCVCSEHCGIGNEVILHVGHRKVGEYYK